MILAWMTYAILVATAAALAASALERAARALGRSTRFIWLSALALSLLWPLYRLTSVLLLAGDTSATAPSRSLLPPVIVAARRSFAAAWVARLTTSGAVASMMLATAWVIVSALLLLRIARGLRELAHRERQWMAREIDGVPVLVAPDLGPAVVGVRRPAIVIPAWALTLDSALRSLVLHHELEHVRARDTAPRLLAALVTALVPWNPALWWQASRLSLALEVDCDARVLRTGARRERYGKLLLAIAQRQSITSLVPALSEPTSHLERRLIVMQHSRPRRPVLAALALACASAVVVALACSVPAPDSPPSANANASQLAGTSSRPVKAMPPYHEFQVENQAVPLPGTKAPRYPDELRKKSIQGTVLAQFVVDATGHPEVITFKVIRSDNALFTNAVKTALPTMRFKPATVGGRPVKQLVQMPFVFSLSL